MASQSLLWGLIGSNTIEGLNMDLPSDSDSSSDDENEQIGEEDGTKAKRTLGYKRAAPGTYDPTTGKTVPPFKDPTDDDQLRWSEWVESMRKDVECVFGIMKGRWRILKVGMRIRGNSDGLKTVDNTWKACCAFHNWLLDGDGYDPAWRGILGNHHEQEDCRRTEIPSAILARMPNGGAEYKSRSEYDSSGMYKGPWRVSYHTVDGGID
jgi:hypothetical protein